MNKLINKFIPVLRFSEFVNEGDWEEKSIGDIAISESSTMALNKLELKPQGYPVYGADSIVGYIDEFQQNEKYISIVKDGSGVGRLYLCVSKSSILGTLACIKSKKQKQYDLVWIYYLLNTVNFSVYIKGAGIPHIYYTDFKNEIVPVPKPKEQQKIADCLSSLDEVIAAHSQKLDALKIHKKGLLQNLLPQEGETAPKLRFKEFEVSGEWVFDEFSEYIKLYRGSSPRPIQNYFTTDESGVNWIKIGDTKNAANFIINRVEEKITPEGAEKSRKVNVGELILANSMSFGKTYQLAIDGYIYDGWFVLREYEKHFDKNFLLQLLNSDYMQNQYKKLSAGGIVQNISSDIVYYTILPHTSVKEQKKIATCLSSIDDLITAQTVKVEMLKAHKKGLMQGLFPTIVK
jgi:type I restriction enzyme S subunit